MDRGCSFSNQPESNHHMPFLPFLGITFGSLALLKLGALSVMVGVLQSVIAVLLFVIVGLIALLALRYVKKQ
jgi:purine-cytosine permease-like protein